MIKHLFGTLLLVVVITSCNNGGSNGSSSNSGSSYQEKVMSVEEMERADPTRFLTADGNYNENFLGNKLKVHGVIHNKATVVTFKDAVVEITFYSKTKTNLGSEKYTIYDFFSPNSDKKFELKIDNYSNVGSIGWDVVSAVPN